MSIMNESNMLYNITTPRQFYRGPPFPSKELLDMMEFKKWAIPVIACIGIPSNLIVFYIFSFSKLRVASSSRYLSAVSIADSGYLCTQLLTHLSSIGLKIYEIHGTCQILMYMNYICTFLSIWYLTAAVLEKFIGLYWPKKKSKFCTIFRAKCVIIGLVVMSVVCYHYITWTVGPDKTQTFCQAWPDTDLLRPFVILNKIDGILVSVIPHYTILILSCLVAIRSVQYHNMSKYPARQPCRRQRACIPHDKEFKTTPSLLTVCFVVFLLSALHSYCRVAMVQDPFLFEISRFFQLNTYSIKPFIYLAVSKYFRTELFSLPKVIRKKFTGIKKSSTAEMQSVSQQTDEDVSTRIVVEKAV